MPAERPSLRSSLSLVRAVAGLCDFRRCESRRGRKMSGIWVTISSFLCGGDWTP